MNFKGLIFIILLAIVVLFFLQNMQPVSLVFFSSKSMTLPLSVWVVIFTIAGIISSLIIQILANSNRQKYSSSKRNERTFSDFSTRGSDPTFYQQRNIPTAENFPTSKPREYSTLSPEEKLSTSPEFDINKKAKIEGQLATGNNQIIKEYNLFTEEDREQQEREEEIVSRSETKENDDIFYPKSRTASLYSYQPKEKTQIRIQPPPRTYPKNGIYDADYRVITPPPQPDRKDDKNDFDRDEGEDWDF